MENEKVKEMEANNIFGPIDIAVSGLRAQNKQLEIISSNVANARSIDSKGQPYRRCEAILKADSENVISGVKLEEIVEDMSELPTILDPGNPRADENGQVQMSNVNLPIEMINMKTATRAYQANTAILKRYQQMVETTLELLK